MRTITALESSEHADAKIALIDQTRDLMPGGRPDYIALREFRRISDLINEFGHQNMQKVIFLLIKDFCNSVNVVRNMNDDQMIECAAMIIDEFSSFRLEEIAVFFSAAKRGKFGKIYDRIDLQVISEMLDKFDTQSAEAWLKEKEYPINRLDSLGPTQRQKDKLHPEDAKIIDGVESLTGALSEMKSRLKTKNDKKQKS